MKKHKLDVIGRKIDIVHNWGKINQDTLYKVGEHIIDARGNFKADKIVQFSSDWLLVFNSEKCRIYEMTSYSSLEYYKTIIYDTRFELPPERYYVTVALHKIGWLDGDSAEDTRVNDKLIPIYDVNKSGRGYSVLYWNTVDSTRFLVNKAKWKKVISISADYLGETLEELLVITDDNKWELVRIGKKGRQVVLLTGDSTQSRVYMEESLNIDTYEAVIEVRYIQNKEQEFYGLNGDELIRLRSKPTEEEM
jgi:hypothetical protein